jgi:5-methylcytosine-specific restriction endonuclease McrA
MRRGREPMAPQYASGEPIAPEIRAALKRSILRGQGGRCTYCRRPLKARDGTFDHVRPLSRGGTWERSNLVIACRGCNHLKDDRDWAPRG